MYGDVGIGFVVREPQKKTGARATGLETRGLRILRVLGQSPNELHQSRPSEFSYFGLPLIEVPDSIEMQITQREIDNFIHSSLRCIGYQTLDLPRTIASVMLSRNKVKNRSHDQTETASSALELYFRDCSHLSSPCYIHCGLHVDIFYLHARVSSCQTCLFVRLDMSVVIVYNIVSYNIINLSF